MTLVDKKVNNFIELTSKRILIVEDDRSMRKGLALELSDRGMIVIENDSFEGGKEAIKAGEYDILLTDLRLDRGEEGFELIACSKKKKPEAPALIITAFGSIEAAVRAMKIGADDFLTKGFTIDELLLKLERVLERQSLLRNKKLLSSQVSELSRDIDNILPKWVIIGESPIMKQIRSQIQDMSRTTFTILITGETGTGKELVARAIHRASMRKTKPFIIVNCSAIPKDLMESELFGYEKGAFSGAQVKKIGYFEAAHRGIIFLDEIGDLDLLLQPKILRAIEYKEFNRVGGTKPVKVDAQIIAATNRNLSEEVKSGNFRKDLLYRLNVLHISLPPLRERRSDIPILAQYFLREFSREFSQEKFSISDEAIANLLSHEWPGNIRELKNAIIRAVALTNTQQISGQLMNQILRNDFQNDSECNEFTEYLRAAVCSQGEELNPESYNKAINTMNLVFTQEAMKQAEGKIRNAAKILGISRNTFKKMMTFQAERDSNSELD